MSKMSRQTFRYLEKKKLLKWNKKHFSLFVKVFQLPEIDTDLSAPLNATKVKNVFLKKNVKISSY